MFIYLFLRERERAQAGMRQRERERIQSTLQAPSSQHRARRGAWTYEAWDHDLSRSLKLNWPNHPGTPVGLSFITNIWLSWEMLIRGKVMPVLDRGVQSLWNIFVKNLFLSLTTFCCEPHTAQKLKSLKNVSLEFAKLKKNPIISHIFISEVRMSITNSILQ